MTFTAEQKRDAIQRELRFRMRVYSRKVLEGSMTKAKSAHELGVMRAILEDYQKLCEMERLI